MARCTSRLFGGALFTLFPCLVGGCGLDPCFQGQLHVELGALMPQSNCLFQDWPGGTEFVIEAVAGREDLGNSCQKQHCEYVPPPEGTRPGGGGPGTGVPYAGYTFASIDTVVYELSMNCRLYEYGEVGFDEAYEDFDSALRAQKRGVEDVFFVRYSYNGTAECAPLFPDPEVGSARNCTNTHRARVTQL